VGVVPPNAENKVQFSVTNVGTAMFDMTGPLTYQGTLGGMIFSGFFIDQSFSSTQGTVTGSGCNGTYKAELGGTCTPSA
jgi:hypothetical protein